MTVSSDHAENDAQKLERLRGALDATRAAVNRVVIGQEASGGNGRRRASGIAAQIMYMRGFAAYGVSSAEREEGPDAGPV